MSSLSIYVGDSNISALRYKTPANFEFASFPYVFPDLLNNEDHAKERFYDQVLHYFIDILKIKTPVDTLFVVSNPWNKVPLPQAQHSDTRSTLSKYIQGYNWILVEPTSLSTSTGLTSYFPIGGDAKYFQDSEFLEFNINRELYPQLQSSNPKVQALDDLLVTYLNIKADNKIKSDYPVVFTGSRFVRAKDMPSQAYLLALNLLRQDGLFKVKVDQGNKLPLIASLQKNLEDVFEAELVNIGTVLKLSGGGQVLFTKNSGNPQFVELTANKIFVLPLEDSDKAKVSFSGKKLPKQEATVSGGRLGLIIDTRESDLLRSDREWIKVLEERLAGF